MGILTSHADVNTADFRQSISGKRLARRLKDTRFNSRPFTWASLKHAVAMEDMLKMMGIEAGSKSKGPADKHGNAIKVKKKKEGSSDGSAMDSQVSA